MHRLTHMDGFLRFRLINIMRIGFFILAYLVYGASLEEKENSCFMLISYFVPKWRNEIDGFVKQHPELGKLDFKGKIVEDGFFACVEKIDEKQVLGVKEDRTRQYEIFEHLVKVELGKYAQGFSEVSDEFMNLRRIIGRRVMRERELFGRDPGL